HLLSAGTWLGALLPLGLLVLQSKRTEAAADIAAAHHGLVRFSGIGPAIVGLLGVTGLTNSWLLLGPAPWHALIATPYGLVLLVKLGLFAGMLGLAALNRYVLTPAIKGQGSSRTALGALTHSVTAETALAVIVLAAVAVLGTLEPPVAVVL